MTPAEYDAAALGLVAFALLSFAIYGLRLAYRRSRPIRRRVGRPE